VHACSIETYADIAIAGLWVLSLPQRGDVVVVKGCTAPLKGEEIDEGEL
jgi:hypothetical protein